MISTQAWSNDAFSRVRKGPPDACHSIKHICNQGAAIDIMSDRSQSRPAGIIEGSLLPQPSASAASLLLDAVGRAPRIEVLVCGDRRLTCAQYADYAFRFAQWLRRNGVVGERVALLLGNSVEMANRKLCRAPIGRAGCAAQLSLYRTRARHWARRRAAFDAVLPVGRRKIHKLSLAASVRGG